MGVVTGQPGERFLIARVLVPGERLKAHPLGHHQGPTFIVGLGDELCQQQLAQSSVHSGCTQRGVGYPNPADDVLGGRRLGHPPLWPTTHYPAGLFGPPRLHPGFCSGAKQLEQLLCELYQLGAKLSIPGTCLFWSGRQLQITLPRHQLFQLALGQAGVVSHDCQHLLGDVPIP